MTRFTLWYANIFVASFDRAFAFYTEKLGLEPRQKDEQFGYASFDTDGASLTIAKVNPDQMDLVGRHSGVGLAVKDIKAAHKDMVDKGVGFTMAPTKQPWGGILALFKDSEGNILYLDQLREH